MNTGFKGKQRHEKRIGRESRSRGMGNALPYLMTIALLAGLLPACGPTREEIMAQEQARLLTEANERQEAEARRQAEQARQERIRLIVTGCSDSAAQGQFDIALIRCQEALREIERYSDQDQQVREVIIKIVRAMPVPPPTPEETLRSMARGEAKVKMGGAGSYEGAAKEMEQAVLAAPWLADAYFNLGIVQEKADLFGQAIQNLRLYLLAAPESPNAKAIQAKVYGLEVMREEQEKLQSLAGSWRSAGGNIYKVTIEGSKIRIEGGSSEKLTDGSVQKLWRVFNLEKKGGSLEGSASIARDSSHGCNFPSETAPVSGAIGGEGRPTRLNWKETGYQWTWQGSVCTGVSSLGKNEQFVELVARVTPGQSESAAPGYSAIQKSPAPEGKKKRK